MAWRLTASQSLRLPESVETATPRSFPPSEIPRLNA
jgi:hypothetical protein